MKAEKYLAERIRATDDLIADIQREMRENPEAASLSLPLESIQRRRRKLAAELQEERRFTESSRAKARPPKTAKI